MRNITIITIMLAFFIFGCSVSSSTKAGSVGADRDQLMLVSSEQVQSKATNKCFPKQNQKEF